MAHKIDKERLSAFLDGELPASERPGQLAHLSECAECAAYVERLRGASANFKKHGPAQMPEALLASALAQARDKKRKAGPRRYYQLLVAFTTAIFLIVVGGMLAKKFAPTLFGQIQGMISGAAGNLGQ